VRSPQACSSPRVVREPTGRTALCDSPWESKPSFPCRRGLAAVGQAERGLRRRDSDPDMAVASAADDPAEASGCCSATAPGASPRPPDWPFSAGLLRASVAVGDFNGDSDPDLAVTNSG
jgi:hypothetical protein